MSWQAYVDTSLVGTGHIDKAAIISIAGDSTWASTAGFTLAANEMKVISDIVKGDAGAKDKAFADGLYIAGDRFVMARAEDGTIYARKVGITSPEKRPKGLTSSQGRDGIAVAKTNQAILVGHHNENQQGGNANQAVQKLADYLVGVNY
ncbi:Profilin [Colletotrichum siamense]|uniref:Profilin n=1 Tax=Colletotrichum siamense TaxID=690259 RepID=UPI00187275AA|nr:Profilin [Colletotrichum siamense]KAF5506003.1 Profilin [Colletotrichum siamense]